MKATVDSRNKSKSNRQMELTANSRFFAPLLNRSIALSILHFVPRYFRKFKMCLKTEKITKIWLSTIFSSSILFQVDKKICLETFVRLLSGFDKFDNFCFIVVHRLETKEPWEGQTLTAPCCDRVVGTASVYPVSRHQNRSRPVSITERGLVAEEPPTQCVSTRVPCVHILACTCRRNSAVPRTLIIIYLDWRIEMMILKRVGLPADSISIYKIQVSVKFIQF